jgi:hypothetical protein
MNTDAATNTIAGIFFVTISLLVLLTMWAAAGLQAIARQCRELEQKKGSQTTPQKRGRAHPETTMQQKTTLPDQLRRDNLR